jgi:hypothetical protein
MGGITATPGSNMPESALFFPLFQRIKCTLHGSLTRPRFAIGQKRQHSRVLIFQRTDQHPDPDTLP